MNPISPDELSERLQSPDDRPLVIDVRSPDEFAGWHIPGSRNVPIYDHLGEDPKAAKAALADLPDDREVVTVCAAGVASQTATAYLVELGYEASTLVDGMNGWSRVHRRAEVDVDIDGTLVQVARPGKGCLSHVLVSNGDAAVFDPSHHVEKYEAILADYEAELVAVYDTHAHADHVSSGRTLAAGHDVPYYLHPADAEAVTAIPVADGDIHEIGTVRVRIIHTPGHSPGGVTFAIGNEALLTGDTLFHESVGRVELGVVAGVEDADVRDNAATLYRSLERIRQWEGDPVVLPAHDPGSPEPPVAARLGHVVRNNTDLGRDRAPFVADLADDLPDHPPNFERVKRVNVGRVDPDGEDLAALELGPNRCAAE